MVDCEAVGGHHDHHRDVEREQRPYHLDNGYILVYKKKVEHFLLTIYTIYTLTRKYSLIMVQVLWPGMRLAGWRMARAGMGLASSTPSIQVSTIRCT